MYLGAVTKTWDMWIREFATRIANHDFVSAVVSQIGKIEPVATNLRPAEFNNSLRQVITSGMSQNFSNLESALKEEIFSYSWSYADDRFSHLVGSVADRIIDIMSMIGVFENVNDPDLVANSINSDMVAVFLPSVGIPEQEVNSALDAPQQPPQNQTFSSWILNQQKKINVPGQEQFYGPAGDAGIIQAGQSGGTYGTVPGTGGNYAAPTGGVTQTTPGGPSAPSTPGTPPPAVPGGFAAGPILIGLGAVALLLALKKPKS